MMFSKSQNVNLWTKNFEKNTVENDTPKIDATKIDAFSSLRTFEMRQSLVNPCTRNQFKDYG